MMRVLVGVLLLCTLIIDSECTKSYPKTTFPPKKKTPLPSKGATTTTTDTYDYARNQILTYKKNKKGAPGVLTTLYGSPVTKPQATTTLNQNIFENQYLFDAMTHFDRERVPERGTHPKGIGAFGFFEVTKDVTKYCRAKFLEKVGKKTEVALRFSQSFRDKGAADTIRGGLGLGVKFYTEDGNLDFTCLNTPTFAIADPINGVSFIHAQKRNPVTNIVDANIIWDYFNILPEQLNAVLFTFSDRGLPDGYKNMDAFPVHTYEIENSKGELFYARFNFLTNQGGKYLLANQSVALAASDPDYFTRDMYNSIARGDNPSWTLYMQIATYKQTQKAPFDLFSVNKYWPKEDYPYIEVGKLVANRNVKNWFNDVEQAAYSPGHLVPGINGGVDSTFAFRNFIYQEQQYHRIGPNFLGVPVNRARNQVASYNRDGMTNPFDSEDGPNYYPNSFGGPEPYVFKNDRNMSLIGKLVPKERADNDLFGLTTKFYLSESEDARLRMASNIAAPIRAITAPGLQESSMKLLGRIHPDLEKHVRAVISGTTTG